MKIYKSCKTLMMGRFYEILETSDYKYLIEEYEGVEISTDLELELTNIWREIFKEYITLKDDGEIKSLYRKYAFVDKLKTKLSICSSLLNGYVSQSTKKGRKDYSEELKEWGFKININLPQQNQVERVMSQLKALKSTIEIKEAEYKILLKKEETKEKFNIDKLIVDIEDRLGGGKTIDPDTTTVSKWVFLVKKAITKKMVA